MIAGVVAAEAHSSCCAACRGTSLCLAVLHPRKLSVYTLQAVGSSYLQLSKLYEHALGHTAANLAYGPFGGVAGEAMLLPTGGHHNPYLLTYMAWAWQSTCTCSDQRCLVGLTMAV